MSKNPDYKRTPLNIKLAYNGGYINTRAALTRWIGGISLTEIIGIGDASLPLWSAGRDTAEIASMLGQPECLVALALPRALERRRQKAA